MKALNVLALSGLVGITLSGCSTGDLRAFNDAMSESNGYSVSYPDQSNTDRVGDIKWTTGVKNGSGFELIRNTGDDYCKVKVDYEDGSERTFNLDPGESTGRRYVSVYNQSENMSTLCNVTARVFSESFN